MIENDERRCWIKSVLCLMRFVKDSTSIKLNINYQNKDVGYRMCLLEYDWEGIHLYLQLTSCSKCFPPSLYLSNNLAKGIRAILSVARSGLLKHKK